MKTNHKLIGLIALGAATVATAVLTVPSFAGKNANRAQIAGAVRNGNVDAIIAKLEKAENMPSTSETINLVEGLLAHDDYRAREAAAWWFARRAFHKDRLTQSGRVALTSNDSTAVRNAADMLGTFRHPRVVSALSTAAGRTDIGSDAKISVVRALGTIANIDGNPAIAAAMGDADAGVRLAALNAWAGILHQADALPATALLGDSDAHVRRVAARIHGTFQESAGRVALENVLATDTDALARRNAAFALGRIGDSASRALLTDAAENDESALVRAYAKTALRTVGL